MANNRNDPGNEPIEGSPHVDIPPTWREPLDEVGVTTLRDLAEVDVEQVASQTGIQAFNLRVRVEQARDALGPESNTKTPDTGLGAERPPPRQQPSSSHRRSEPKPSNPTSKPDQSNQATTGSISKDMAGVGALLGAGIGLGTLLLLHNMEAFDNALSAAVLGGSVVRITMLIAISVGMVLAVIAGLHAGGHMRGDHGAAGWAGAAGGTVAHVALVVSLGLVLGIGFAVSSPVADDSGTGDGGTDPGESDTGFDAQAVLTSLLGLLPAALVGGGTARIVSERG